MSLWRVTLACHSLCRLTIKNTTSITNRLHEDEVWRKCFKTSWKSEESASSLHESLKCPFYCFIKLICWRTFYIFKKTKKQDDLIFIDIWRYVLARPYLSFNSEANASFSTTISSNNYDHDQLWLWSLTNINYCFEFYKIALCQYLCCRERHTFIRMIFCNSLRTSIHKNTSYVMISRDHTSSLTYVTRNIDLPLWSCLLCGVTTDHREWEEVCNEWAWGQKSWWSGGDLLHVWK